MVVEYITKFGAEIKMGNVEHFELDHRNCILSIECADGYTCKIDQVIEAYALDEIDHTIEEEEDLSELIEELRSIRWGIGSTSMDYWSSEGKEAKALDKVINLLESN